MNPELARLRDEVRAARVQVRGAVATLRRRARDPFGFRARIRAHPYATAGIALGCGLVAATLFTRRRRAEAAEAPQKREPGPFAPLIDSAVKTAVSTAVKTAATLAGGWLQARSAASEATPESE